MDDFGDLEELGINDDENDEFHLVANHVQTILSKLKNEDLLQLYGFYKQGLEGNCKNCRPSWFDFRAKAKWDAWSALKDMPKSEAKQKYIQLVYQLDPGSASELSTSKPTSVKEGWVTVSTLQKPSESDNEDDDCDALSACVKAGDHSAVERALGKDKDKYTLQFDWNKLDKEGLALIHWATDRGCTKIIKSLVQSGADIHARDGDGQAAIHYASSCGHVECIELLLELGADPTVKDCHGCDAFDAAADDAVRDLLTTTSRHSLC